MSSKQDACWTSRQAKHRVAETQLPGNSQLFDGGTGHGLDDACQPKERIGRQLPLLALILPAVAMFQHDDAVFHHRQFASLDRTLRHILLHGLVERCQCRDRNPAHRQIGGEIHSFCMRYFDRRRTEREHHRQAKQ